MRFLGHSENVSHIRQNTAMQVVEG
jgi:hypothetical protein